MIDTAVRLEPDNTEQFFLLVGQFDFDGGAGAERVAGPAFDLRQVKGHGVPIGRPDAWPGRCLIQRHLSGSDSGSGQSANQICQPEPHGSIPSLRMAETTFSTMGSISATRSM